MQRLRSGTSLLLERERELAALESFLAAARAGRGGVMVVEGDAGVGKSRLLLAARAGAERSGMRVLGARGSELERGFAFGIARQLLGERVHRARSTAWDGGETALAAILEFYDAVLGLAAGDPESAAVLVVVDDAQWADDPSLRFLAHLALRIEDRPVAVALAVRSGEPQVSEMLLQQLRESPGAGVLRPAPLSEAAVASLVKTVLGEQVDRELPAACLRATGGNPFFLSELLRTLASESGPLRPERVGQVAPRGVLRSVVVRLARLGDHAPALARAAAVLGDGAPLDRAARLAGIEERAAEAAADALTRAGIFDGGEPLRFRHPLIAAALEADMGSFERAREHRRAAELLMSERADSEAVAAHLMVARPDGDPRAAAVLEQAAERAVSSGSPRVAVGLLERALTEAPAADDEARLLLALAKADALAGSAVAAARLESALERFEPGEPRAAAMVELATLAHLQWDFPRAVELAARARAEGSPVRLLEEKLLAIELSAATLAPGVFDALEQRLETVLADARAGHPPSDPRLLAIVVARLGIEDPPAAVLPLIEIVIAGDALIDDSHGASVGWVAAALEWIDELEMAERWLGDAVLTATRRGEVISASIAMGNRARVRYFLGMLSAAADDAERALEIYRYGWSNSPWSTPVLADSYVAVGNLEAARTAIAIGERARAGAPDHGRLLEARARLSLAEGDPARALENARAAGDEVEGRAGSVQPRVWEWRRLAALAAHRLGDDEQALELLEPDLRLLCSVGPARQLAAALTVAGMATGGHAGLDLIAKAAAMLDGSPARLQRTETLLELGRALRRAGRRNAARDSLYAALQLAAETGAAPLEREAREELGRLGLRPRRSAQTGVASLTPTEEKVAELAGDGLTTPEIAARLYVTRNTVETHLRHIYQKLNVSRRGELREALAETTEVP